MSQSPADFYAQVRAMLAGSRGETPRKRRRRQAAKIFDLDPLPFFTAGDEDGNNRAENGNDPIGLLGASERKNPQLTAARSFYERFQNRHIEPHWKPAIDSQGALGNLLVWSAANGMQLTTGTGNTLPAFYARLQTDELKNGQVDIRIGAYPADESAVHVFMRGAVNSFGDLSGYSAGFDGTTFNLWRWDNGTPTLLGTAAGTPIDTLGIQCIGTSVSAYYTPSGGGAAVTFASVTDATYNVAGYVGTLAEFTGAGITLFAHSNFDLL